MNERRSARRRLADGVRTLPGVRLLDRTRAEHLAAAALREHRFDLAAARLDPDWVSTLTSVDQPLDDFKLFGILGTWREADVVDATVRNAFAQGCDEVFLVDNDSPDDTTSIATAAGAKLAASFSLTNWDDNVRFSILNSVVYNTSEASGLKNIWWLWFDGDEFPHGPHGSTIREYVARLDRRIRVAGARYVNHYPERGAQYVEGFHPLEFISLAADVGGSGNCPSGHHKHPLMRYDRGRPYIRANSGFHRGSAAEALWEPPEPVVIRHFPYRNREVTEARLRALCAPADGEARVAKHNAWLNKSSNTSRRFALLDAVYEGDWQALVRDGALHQPPTVDVPTNNVGNVIRRWYTADALDGARERDT